MEVGGKDRDQEYDQSPGGQNLTFRDEKHYAQDDLKNAAQINQFPMPRQVRRHDFHERDRADPMEKPRRNEDRGEQPFRDEFEEGHTTVLLEHFYRQVIAQLLRTGQSRHSLKVVIPIHAVKSSRSCGSTS
jgi:hypothetical protein